jgi:galactofuranose transport system substrate-binding protein
VFLIDREAAGTPGRDYVCFIGSDFVEQARRVAEWLVNHTGARTSLVERTGTRADFRAPWYAGHRVADGGLLACRSTKRDAEYRAGQTDRDYDCVCQYDEIAIGAIQALKVAGLQPGRDVTVVSIDGERAALEAIIEGELAATGESNPRFGPLALATLERYRATR